MFPASAAYDQHFHLYIMRARAAHEKSESGQCRK
jgi:hypothetical protein